MGEQVFYVGWWNYANSLNGCVVVSEICTIPASQKKKRKWIYRAWLPSGIFPKYANAVEWDKTIASRFQRATKREKFSRAAWEFDVVPNSRQ